MQAFLDAAICFFVPFLAASPTGSNSAVDIFSVGKTINICMLGIVTMEIMIVTRYWTWWFGFICTLSYTLVYPYVLVFPLFQQAVNTWDMAHFGVGSNIMRTAYFWICLITVYSMTFSIRYFERSTKWLFRPDENMIRAELEVLDGGRRGLSAAPSQTSLSFGDPEAPSPSGVQNGVQNGGSPAALPDADPAEDPAVCTSQLQRVACASHAAPNVTKS